MRKIYVKLILHLAGGERSPAVKILALAVGAFLFLGLIPWCLIRLGAVFSHWLAFRWPPLLNYALGALSLILGLFWIGWSILAQSRLGGGTPNPAAPTRRLIVRGPYRLCRNPLQLGAMFYYLGLGSLTVDAAAGLLAFVIALAVGSAYHRYFEEEELKARFGEAYEEYRGKTPFLIPRIW